MVLCQFWDTVILEILLQKTLYPEMRHMVFTSIIFNCLANFSEESEMIAIQWNVQWWNLEQKEVSYGSQSWQENGFHKEWKF